jgi:hypothetical protein
MLGTNDYWLHRPKVDPSTSHRPTVPSKKIGAKGTGCAMFAEKYLQRCYREGRQNGREEGRAEGLEKGSALANEARGAWYQRLLAAPSEGRPSHEPRPRDALHEKES